MEMVQKILGFDNYEIDMTDFFNVKVFSLDYNHTGKRVELKPHPLDTKGSHLGVCICNNGEQYTFGLHQLVWRQFHGEVPKGYDVHHDNLDANDNRPENLILMTHSKHMELHMRIRHKQKDFKYQAKKCVQLDKDGKLIKEWESVRDAMRFYGTNVNNCLRGKSKTAYGFIWRYT